MRQNGQDRRGLRLPHADYNTMSLTRMDFREADLSEAGFRHSWIRDCDFRGADLTHADLTDAIYDENTIRPAGFAREHGRLTGRCCFCNQALCDERSTAAGYGETCARHFSLPWGEKEGV